MAILAAASIVLLSVIAAFGLPLETIEIDFSTAMQRILAGALALVAVTNLITTRFVVMPSIIAGPREDHGRTPDPAERRLLNAAVVGYSFALACTIYGIVLAFVTQRGLIALPFGAFALLFWLTVWLFLRDNPPKMAPDLGG